VSGTMRMVGVLRPCSLVPDSERSASGRRIGEGDELVECLLGRGLGGEGEFDAMSVQIISPSRETCPDIYSPPD
jgi:hypothetical protein